MQEQQGNLEEPLSGLPGPRPFNKNNKRDVPMEDSNNKELNDIVARATEALSSGKAFGGWTDKVDESSFKQMQVDRAQRERESDGSNQKDEGIDIRKIATDLGSATKKDGQVNKSGTLPGLMTPKEKGTKVGVLSHVEHDGESLDEKVAEGVGQIGVAVREGAKGAVAGAALGSILPGIGTIAGGLLGYALGDAGAAVTGIGKKKKTWDEK